MSNFKSNFRLKTKYRMVAISSDGKDFVERNYEFVFEKTVGYGTTNFMTWEKVKEYAPSRLLRIVVYVSVIENE